MRHLKRTAKLGRTGSHRNAMLANLACSLIKSKRITTTISKAKALRPVVEKLVSLGKRGDLHARRLAASRLPEKEAVSILFGEIAVAHKSRKGGYTRIIRLMNDRRGDASQMAIIEWVDSVEISASAESAPGTTSSVANPNTASADT